MISSQTSQVRLYAEKKNKKIRRGARDLNKRRGKPKEYTKSIGKWLKSRQSL